MGTTLQNGVYLPNEGERNCYAGLKTNWEILDQKVADVTALQQAVAGALHREIVASLPTTDIDPNTIYMILSGTSATKNVYNEFMYVNNAWELIGTSATDLTNYYTKGDVDGLLVLKANASDLTSHTGDTTIHVTASDKSKWNTVALIKQLRLVNAQVGSATTIAFANIDDTNGIKVGDKCMDLDAKMFEITAVDTTNQTVTVGTALIDLALDANVVHTSGDETVSGAKTFSNTATFGSVNVEDIRWKSLVNQTVDLNDCYVPRAGAISGYYTTDISSGANISNKATNTAFTMLSLTTRRVSASDYQVRQVFYGSGSKYVRTCSNGTWTAWVNETDKFVTTDTNQTITGAKTFTSDLSVYNASSANTPIIIGKSSVSVRDSTNTNGDNLRLSFYDKNNNTVSYIRQRKLTNGNTDISFNVYNTDANNQLIEAVLNFVLDSSNNPRLSPGVDNTISLGVPTFKYRDINTYKINGLTPSSLGMPVAPSSTSYVDISGYITVLDSSSANTYTPPSNGYITFSVTGNLVQIFHDYGLQGKWTVQAGNANRGFIPVLGGVEVKIYLTASNVDKFWFIPCQGNI